MKATSNETKIYLAIFLSLLVSPLIVLAAATSATFDSTSYVQLTVGGVTRTFEVSGTGIESITVNESTGNFTLNFLTGAMTSANIVSSNKLDFTISPTITGKIFTCGSSNSTLSLTRGSSDASITVTVTPSADTCTGSSGTGGGGGYSSGATSVAQTVAQPSPVAQVVSRVFNNDLVLGQQNDDVRRLQELLAGDKYLYPEGLVTGFFGPATERAVKRFQAKYNLLQVGRAGPMTRAKLQEVFAGKIELTPAPTPKASVVVQPSSVAAAVSPVFATSLKKGVSNDDVKRLQQLLATDSEIYPEGTASGYYGTLTEKAVQKFQMKYGVVSSPSDAGYGSVGPKTRQRLQEVFGQGQSSAPAPAAPAVSAAEEAQNQALKKQLDDLQKQLDTMLKQAQQ